MRAVHADTDPLRRPALELARTGIRVSELCGLEADAVVRIGDTHWLRVPVGTLHNDRYVPLHPIPVELLNARAMTAQTRPDGCSAATADQHMMTRMCRLVPRCSGISHVHPHRFRHTLAAQTINWGRSRDASPHCSLDMTRRDARITNTAEYDSLTSDIDALHTSSLPSDGTEGPGSSRLPAEHHRMLGSAKGTAKPAFGASAEPSISARRRTLDELCCLRLRGPSNGTWVTHIGDAQR